jgi:hypothetical protein
MTSDKLQKTQKLVKELWTSKYISIPIQTNGVVDFSRTSSQSAIAKVSIIKRITPLNKLTNIGEQAFPTTRAS